MNESDRTDVARRFVEEVWGNGVIEGGRIVEVWHDEDIQGMVDQLGGLPT
jgi:hypothetical protein